MNKLILTMASLAIATTTLAGNPVDGLRNRLVKLQDKGIMIGHQDDPLYGTTWKWDENRSDVKETCGDYPAVMGFELGNIENGADKSLDGVPFDRIRQEVANQHARGGIVTISWHPYNPETGKDAWDPSGYPVGKILPGGALSAKFNGWLDILVTYFNSLKTAKGDLIPVIFRPWHEMSGGWFWWGKESCTPTQYKQLYRYTVNYLKEHGVTNLLYAYSPGGTPQETEENFMKFYPGDSYVDLVGADLYASPDRAKYVKEMKEEFAVVTKVATDHNKIACVAETGFRNTPDAEWFTKGLWEAVKDFKLSYVLLWRNAWDQAEENFGPAPNKTCADDFRKLYSDPKTLFLKDVVPAKPQTKKAAKKKNKK